MERTRWSALAVLALLACGTSAPAPGTALQGRGPAADPEPVDDPGEREVPVAAAAAPGDGGSADAAATVRLPADTPDGGANVDDDTATAPPLASPPRQCVAERWNGWEGTPACRQTARRLIPARDLGCTRDVDCALVGTNCDPHAVSVQAAARYERWPAPCAPPGAGNCAGPGRAVCRGGCCMPDLLGGP